MYQVKLLSSSQGNFTLQTQIEQVINRPIPYVNINAIVNSRNITSPDIIFGGVIHEGYKIACKFLSVDPAPTKHYAHITILHERLLFGGWTSLQFPLIEGYLSKILTRWENETYNVDLSNGPLHIILQYVLK